MILNSSDFVKIENIKAGDNPLDIRVIQGGEARAFNPDGDYGSFDVFMADGCLYIRHDGSDAEMGVFFDGPAVSDTIGIFGIVELLNDNSFADKGRYIFPTGKNCVTLKKTEKGVLLDFSEYRPDAVVADSQTPERRPDAVVADSRTPERRPDAVVADSRIEDVKGSDGNSPDAIKKRLDNLRGDVKADIDILGGIGGVQSAAVTERLRELEEIAEMLENAMAELVERRNSVISEHLNNG
ncbi:MAG: hypothetical protein LBI36_03430 [Oscillospiraceae bacterium]|jgi:hypothetical protein|nr:hypothetical protein [Oscillospiraceae bacterium]